MSNSINEITCLMLYYGRKLVAEEAIESFLRQTYPHKKLLIVNTHPDPVWFEKEHKDIEVHNIAPDPFEKLNDKYNYAFDQIKTKWWCPWDSDDIWLPWHLENLANHISKTQDKQIPKKIGVPQSYFMIGKRKTIIIGWQMWGDCIFEARRDGKIYPKCDTSLVDNCDRQITFMEWDRYWLNLNKYPRSFIFRWDMQIPHRSSVLGKDGLERERRLRENMNRISITEPMNPHWEIDYVEHTKGPHEIAKNIDEVKAILRKNKIIMEQR